MPRERSGAWLFDWRQSWPDVWQKAFVDDWNRLYDASPTANVYQRPAVVRAWAETCGAGVQAKPLIGLAEGPGGARILLPWAVHRIQGRFSPRRQLGYAGDDLFGYHDPLVAARLAPLAPLPPLADQPDRPDRPDQAGRAASGAIEWPELWRSARAALSDAHDQAIFRAVDARLAPADAGPAGDESPVLYLNRFSDYQQLFESCSSGHRSDVRRHYRQLAQRGEVQLWIAAAHEGEEALADWQAFGAPAYQELWARRNRRNTTFRRGLDELLSRLLTQGLAEGWGHYTVLRVNGESIAWHVGLADRGRLYYWIPTYRFDWQSFSPGTALLAGLIEHLMGQGWRELHFLTGAHAYKLSWRPDRETLRAIRWHAPGLRGAIFSWYDALRSA